MYALIKTSYRYLTLGLALSISLAGCTNLGSPLGVRKDKQQTKATNKTPEEGRDSLPKTTPTQPNPLESVPLQGSEVFYNVTGALLGGTKQEEEKKQEVSHTLQKPRNSIVAIQQYRASNKDISNTQKIIHAFNSTQNTGQRKTLRRWLRLYIEVFKNPPTKMGGLTHQDIREYSHIAQINVQDQEDMQLLCKYLAAFGQKLEKSKFDYLTAEALELALPALNLEAFKKHQQQRAKLITTLTNLANELIKALRPEENNFSTATYPFYVSTFASLQQIFLLIKTIDPDGWEKDS